jgi:hypothetical protein
VNIGIIEEQMKKDRKINEISKKITQGLSGKADIGHGIAIPLSLQENSLVNEDIQNRVIDTTMIAQMLGSIAEKALDSPGLGKYIVDNKSIQQDLIELLGSSDKSFIVSAITRPEFRILLKIYFMKRGFDVINKMKDVKVEAKPIEVKPLDEPMKHPPIVIIRDEDLDNNGVVLTSTKQTITINNKSYEDPIEYIKFTDDDERKKFGVMRGKILMDDVKLYERVMMIIIERHDKGEEISKDTMMKQFINNLPPEDINKLLKYIS